ncbi:MAG: hypothetical protein ABIG93_03870 [archaeon]|nr:hypothetical protein [Nanoarchaeota archaeon]
MSTNGNKVIVRAYVQALEESLDSLKIVQSGIGAITGRAKYHINDSSVAKLIRQTAVEIGYDNRYCAFGTPPREKLYWSFNGHGLDSPGDIRTEITNLIEAAKKTLPAKTEE